MTEAAMLLRSSSRFPEPASCRHPRTRTVLALDANGKELAAGKANFRALGIHKSAVHLHTLNAALFRKEQSTKL